MRAASPCCNFAPSCPPVFARRSSVQPVRRRKPFQDLPLRQTKPQAAHDRRSPHLPALTKTDASSSLNPISLFNCASTKRNQSVRHGLYPAVAAIPPTSPAAAATATSTSRHSTGGTIRRIVRAIVIPGMSLLRRRSGTTQKQFYVK